MLTRFWEGEEQNRQVGAGRYKGTVGREEKLVMIHVSEEPGWK